MTRPRSPAVSHVPAASGLFGPRSNVPPSAPTALGHVLSPYLTMPSVCQPGKLGLGRQRRARVARLPYLNGGPTLRALKLFPAVVLVASSLVAAGSATGASALSSTCSSGDLTGTYPSSLTITGVCYVVNGSSVTVDGNLTIATGAMLDAISPGGSALLEARSREISQLPAASKSRVPPRSSWGGALSRTRATATRTVTPRSWPALTITLAGTSRRSMLWP